MVDSDAGRIVILGSEQSMLGLGLIELIVLFAVVGFVLMIALRRSSSKILSSRLEETIDALPPTDSSNPYAPSNVSRRVVRAPGSRVGLILLLFFVSLLVAIGAMLGFFVATPMRTTVPMPVTGGSTAPAPAAAPPASSANSSEAASKQ